MTSPVIIKGNQQGLRFIIAPDAEISDVVSTIEKGLKSVDNKQKSKRCPAIRISLEGERLDKRDIEYLQTALSDLGLNTYIDIDKDVKKAPKDEGLFLVGSIRRGQIVEASESIIILGDVEAGARVMSKSNVIIIGRQDGYVEAGVDGDSTSFVYSLIPGRSI